jgi:hypothetical protein
MCTELLSEEEQLVFVSEQWDRMRAFTNFIDKIFRQDGLIDDFYKYVVETYGEVSLTDREALIRAIADLNEEEEESKEEESSIDEIVNKYAVLHIDDGGLYDVFNYVSDSIRFNPSISINFN